MEVLLLVEAVGTGGVYYRSAEEGLLGSPKLHGLNATAKHIMR